MILCKLFDHSFIRKRDKDDLSNPYHECRRCGLQVEYPPMSLWCRLMYHDLGEPHHLTPRFTAAECRKCGTIEVYSRREGRYRYYYPDEKAWYEYRAAMRGKA